jgi:hypothetical protein
MADVLVGRAGSFEAFVPEPLHGRDAHATSEPPSSQGECPKMEVSKPKDLIDNEEFLQRGMNGV